ncbi:MAG: hypothetical protein A3F67_08830 [Verrucomicrobia bacterium RIFCSPHIGHO2_12_FULL_41_10]|nr:MAG: hypothetical protein A3F67_08830 [Verrucomicrobia bacterium RIFCSPHIGHO2_12_FULL_41_10]HLB32916.1 FkbM family methyltransferase [Chthoniobacterales bacterium]
MKYFFETIFNNPQLLSNNSSEYKQLSKELRSAIEASDLSSKEPKDIDFQPFGPIKLPFHEMGAINSLDLFGLDEMIIFAFYWLNRDRYKRSADIGANLGIHSILMDKCGWNVTAFEPDPDHAELLHDHLKLNHSDKVTVVEAAVSADSGNMEFTRVLGNTTSSHLTGAKENAYGELETFPVKVISIKSIMPSVDFIKMDAEGHEKTIILATDQEDWKSTEMMLEIGSKDNALAIFNHLQHLKLHAFAQKIGWKEVHELSQMPINYKEGSLFITPHLSMSW